VRVAFFTYSTRLRELSSADGEAAGPFGVGGKLHAEGLQTMDEDDDQLTAMARELVTRQGVGEKAAEVWRALTKITTTAGTSVLEESPTSQLIDVPKAPEEPEPWIPSKGAAVQLSLF
jgi:hypothetical protein